MESESCSLWRTLQPGLRAVVSPSHLGSLLPPLHRKFSALFFRCVADNFIKKPRSCNMETANIKLPTERCVEFKIFLPWLLLCWHVLLKIILYFDIPSRVNDAEMVGMFW